MNGIPWGELKEIVHFCGYVILIIWAIRFVQFLIGTVCVRFCPHCQRKV